MPGGVANGTKPRVAQVRSIKVTLHGKSLGVPEMAGPMSAAVIKGALNLLLAQEVSAGASCSVEGVFLHEWTLRGVTGSCLLVLGYQMTKTQ